MAAATASEKQQQHTGSSKSRKSVFDTQQRRASPLTERLIAALLTLLAMLTCLHLQGWHQAAAFTAATTAAFTAATRAAAGCSAGGDAAMAERCEEGRSGLGMGRGEQERAGHGQGLQE
jgi:hypothetical protein